MSRFRRALAAIPAVGVFILTIVLMTRAVLRHTGGIPSYPVDDAFIHLAMAKTLVLHGTYGVQAGQFVSSSSSIAWPFVLAGAMKLHSSDWMPLVLNLIVGCFIPFVAVDLATRLGSRSALRSAAVALLVILLGPVSTLAMVGMEHVFHVLLMITFVGLASTMLASDEGQKPVAVWPVAVTAAAMAATRYEAAIPIALVTVLFAVRRRFVQAGLVAAAGALPVILFGIFSKLHGGYWLPLSVLLKQRPMVFRNLSSLADLLGGDLAHRLGNEPHLLTLAVLLGAVLAWSVRARGFFHVRSLAALIVLVTLLGHVQFAGLGWFYRYDSYLVASGVAVLGSLFSAEVPRLHPRQLWRSPTLVSWLAAALVILGLGKRASDAFASTPTASRNIFEQQVHTARFLQSEFPDDLVAINDLGAVAYYRSGPVLDLVGLASFEVARAKNLHIDEPMTRAEFESLTQGVAVAVVYDEWFPGQIPTTWFRVAKWTIEQNRVCAFPSVSVYATSLEGIPRVFAAARRFSSRLPETVRQEGMATETFTSEATMQAGDIFELTPSAQYGDTTKHLVAVDDDGWLQFPGIVNLEVRGKTLAELPTLVAKDPGHRFVDTLVRITPRPARAYTVGNVLAPREDLLSAPLPDDGLRIDEFVRDIGGTSTKPYVLRFDGAQLVRVDSATVHDLDLVVVP